MQKVYILSSERTKSLLLSSKRSKTFGAASRRQEASLAMSSRLRNSLRSVRSYYLLVTYERTCPQRITLLIASKTSLVAADAPDPGLAPTPVTLLYL